MADVKNPQKLVDDIAKQENAEDREMIAGPLRKAKNYIADKLKGMDQRTLQQVTTDKMDQRSLEDVFKGKPPKYKEEVAKKKGGSIKGYKAGGKVRGCGIAQKGLTKGKMV